ncbi:hypothetical protein ACFL20_11080 [Spirochaetota bacterium]
MKIGFTGTRNGMSDKQKDSFAKLIRKYKTKYHFVELHHGDCIGADEDAHTLIIENYLTDEVHIHPPRNEEIRANTYEKKDKKKSIKFKLYDPRPYVERNHDIVDLCEVIIAAPKEYKEQSDSDTWITVRYCKMEKKRTIIIYPDGKSTMWPQTRIKPRPRPKDEEDE